jgi:ATP-dependent DNA ligase
LGYEVKWDGYRLAVHVETRRVWIIMRGGHDWTSYFAAIAAAAKGGLDDDPATMILDGEAVVLDEKRLPTDLIYVGHAGAGFFRKVARDLKCNWISANREAPGTWHQRKEIRLCATDTGRGVAWTHDGKLRHPSFKGMREVADHAEVFDLEGLKAGN